MTLDVQTRAWASEDALLALDELGYRAVADRLRRQRASFREVLVALEDLGRCDVADRLRQRWRENG